MPVSLPPGLFEVAGFGFKSPVATRYNIYVQSRSKGDKSCGCHETRRFYIAATVSFEMQAPRVGGLTEPFIVSAVEM